MHQRSFTIYRKDYFVIFIQLRIMLGANDIEKCNLREFKPSADHCNPLLRCERRQMVIMQMSIAREFSCLIFRNLYHDKDAGKIRVLHDSEYSEPRAYLSVAHEEKKKIHETCNRIIQKIPSMPPSPARDRNVTPSRYARCSGGSIRY